MPELRRPSIDTLGAALPLAILTLLVLGLCLLPGPEVLP